MRDQRRVEWVDIAKAFAIILVVIYHAAVIGMPLDLVSPGWRVINKGLEAFRMPVFFFAAGLFAESVVRRPWRELWSSRLALLVWTFGLWTVLRFLYFTAVPLHTRPLETDPHLLLFAPVWPTTGLWFLHALAVFFVLTKLIRRVPLWTKLVVSAALSALFFSTWNLSYDGMARYYLFFLCGAYLRDLVLTWNEPPRWGLSFIVFVAFCAVQASIDRFIGELPGSRTVMSLMAIAAGCLLARVMAQTPVAKWLVYIGKNTLPVYVLHVILLAAMSTVADRYLSNDLGAIAAFSFPVAAAIIVIPLSLWLSATSAKRQWSRRLFLEAPAWLRRNRTNGPKTPGMTTGQA
jgi:uncharacterized membrane protein YcfT